MAFTLKRDDHQLINQSAGGGTIPTATSGGITPTSAPTYSPPAQWSSPSGVPSQVSSSMGTIGSSNGIVQAAPPQVQAVQSQPDVQNGFQPIAEVVGNSGWLNATSSGYGYDGYANHNAYDILGQQGTPVPVPTGQYTVESVFNSATDDNTDKDFNLPPSNFSGGGWGNSVVLRNNESGELVRLSHMATGSVNAQPGQIVQGGQIIGAIGSTGRSTAPHTDLQYYGTSDMAIGANAQQAPQWLLDYYGYK